jgi:molecular chaperone GrpE
MNKDKDKSETAEPSQEVLEDGDSIEALKAEVAAAKDQALRYAADADNTRRRAEREINDARAYAIQKFSQDLFGVADNLARALEHAPHDAADPLVRGLAVGLEMTQKDLQGAFERNGLKRIAPTPGDKFDPHQHQAMMEQPSGDVAPGSIAAILQSGYELFGRVVRPALVVVASKAPEAPGESGRQASADGDGDAVARSRSG